jgi:hypothetical protein
VDVVEINDRPTPEHDQVVRVQAVLHWRGTTERQKQSAERNAYQLPPDGYFIDWSRATLGAEKLSHFWPFLVLRH